MKKKKIVAAGMLCLDITPVFGHSQIRQIQELLVPGKLLEVGRPQLHTGGSAANSGLAFQFFGGDAVLMGRVGQDPFGEVVARMLREHGAKTHLAVDPEESTATTFVLAPPGIDRIFLHHPGANNRFSAGDLDFDLIRQGDLFHFGYPTHMAGMYQNQAAGFLELFRRVKALGTLTSLDLALVDPQSEAAAVDWQAVLQKAVPLVDFFVPSAEELCLLIDPPRYAQWIQRAGSRDLVETLEPSRDLRPLANRLLDWGAKVILIKCGAPGMYLRTAGQSAMEALGPGFRDWADLEWFEPSFQPHRYRSATGAGDVSLAAFLLAALEGRSPRESLEMATGAGACCVSAYDSLSGLLTFAEMREKIKKGWPKRQPGSG